MSPNGTLMFLPEVVCGPDHAAPIFSGSGAGVTVESEMNAGAFRHDMICDLQGRLISLAVQPGRYERSVVEFPFMVAVEETH